MRDLKQHLRETGEIKGYNPGFSHRDRSAFLVGAGTRRCGVRFARLILRRPAPR